MNWKHKIKITLPSNPSEAGPQLAARLKKLPESFRERGDVDTLDDMIVWLNDLSEGADSNDYDNVLGEIYDWADRHRLWLEIDYEGA